MDLRNNNSCWSVGLPVYASRYVPKYSSTLPIGQILPAIRLFKWQSVKMKFCLSFDDLLKFFARHTHEESDDRKVEECQVSVALSDATCTTRNLNRARKEGDMSSSKKDIKCL